MARPRRALPSAQAIRALADGDGRLMVRATPGARFDAVEIVAGKLHAQVRAQPEDGKANAAILKLLADALGVAPSRLGLIGGATAREKRFQLD